MIKQVALFVSDTTTSNISEAPKDLVPAADRGLRLNGELVQHMMSNDPPIETASAMTDSQWSSFLNARFPGKSWRRWFGKKGPIIYSVVDVES